MLICKDNLPSSLFAYPQWVLWRYKSRGEGKKPDKQPVNPKTLGGAGVTWPNTWTPFPYAYERYREAVQGHPRYHHTPIEGLGFVLTPSDPIVAIDLDSCVEEETFTPFAHEVIEALGSYTEISPSGHGLRILVACPDYRENHKTPDWEIYAQERYVTVTGRHVMGTPPDIQTVPASLLTELLPPPAVVHEPVIYPDLYQPAEIAASDQALWEHIFAIDAYGREHYDRFWGDTSHDDNDHSMAVIRLLNALAYHTKGDASRMRRMMLLSSLSNDKWFSRRPTGDWLDHEIKNAIDYTLRKRPGRALREEEGIYCVFDANTVNPHSLGILSGLKAEGV